MKHYAKANSLVVFFKGRLTVLQINGSHPSVQLAAACKKSLESKHGFCSVLISLENASTSGHQEGHLLGWALSRLQDVTKIQGSRGRNPNIANARGHPAWDRPQALLRARILHAHTKKHKGGWLTDTEPIHLAVCSKTRCHQQRA